MKSLDVFLQNVTKYDTKEKRGKSQSSLKTSPKATDTSVTLGLNIKKGLFSILHREKTFKVRLKLDSYSVLTLTYSGLIFLNPVLTLTYSGLGLLNPVLALTCSGLVLFFTKTPRQSHPIL